MKYGLEDHIIDSIQGVFKSFDRLEKVILYGSRALGTYKEGSDIDLSIFGSDLSINYLQQIELSLDELMLPYQIDLSIFSFISNDSLVEHINRIGIDFYIKE